MQTFEITVDIYPEIIISTEENKPVYYFITNNFQTKAYYYTSTVHITGYYEIHAGSRSSNINAYIITKDRNGDELYKRMIDFGNEL